MTDRIDAVVRRILSPGDIRGILDGLGSSGKDVFHHPVGDDGILSAFAIREHRGVRFLGSNGLVLGPGVIYTSADTEDLTMAWTAQVHSVARIEISGQEIPEALLAALPGRPASDVVGHPALRDPRLVVTGSGWAPYTVIKSRNAPTNPAAAPPARTVRLTLAQVIDAIDETPRGGGGAHG